MPVHLRCVDDGQIFFASISRLESFEILCHFVGPVLTCVSKDYDAHISPPTSCTMFLYLLQTTPTVVGRISWPSSGC
jgi:hypothetical protein